MEVESDLHCEAFRQDERGDFAPSEPSPLPDPKQEMACFMQRKGLRGQVLQAMVTGSQVSHQPLWLIEDLHAHHSQIIIPEPLGLQPCQQIF